VDRHSAIVSLRAPAPGALSRSDSTDPDSILALIDPSTGFLIVDGRVSRGNVVQQYSDGVETWGELRRVEDVFDEAAVASMHPRPIVDADHTWVDTDNWGAVSKGATGPARVDEATGWATQQLAICDADMIAAVVDGEVIEISLGYECELVPEEGELDGVRYSFRQTNVRVNHAALGPRDWARAGNDARLIFDSRDKPDGGRVGVQVIEGDSTMKSKHKPKGKNKDTQRKSTDSKPTAKRATKDGTLMLGETEYEVADEVIEYIESLQAMLAEKSEDESEPEVMDEDEERDDEDEDEDEKKSDSKTRDKLDAIADAFKRYREDEPKRVDARARLFADAREILGRNAQLDGLPASAIHKQVIDRLLGDRAPKLDGKSDAYVEATYDTAMQLHRDSNSIGRVIGAGQIHGHHGDSKTPTLDSLQAEMIARMTGKKAS
jgi:hypothetical protein